MRAQLMRGFLLDGVLVEPLKGLVSHRDHSSHLPPKAVDVLMHLAEHPGDLVNRDKLLTSIWGSHNGSQDALNHAVSEIRQALDDDPHDPRFIQTVPKRGYRLLVEPRLSEDHEAGSEESAFRLTDTPPFFRELMRRKVVQTAVAYLVVGWLLMQIADTTFDNLGLPWWSTPFVTMLVVTGFPIAIVLSWFIDFAGGRFRLESSRRSARQYRSTTIYMAVLGALVVSAGLLGMYRLLDEEANLFGEPPESAEHRPLPVELDIPVQPNSVAVLRFLNIGGDPMLSDGLSENLLHLLAGFSEVSVPSRTSTWSMAAEDRSATELAEMLHVRYVLEGSVQQAEDNIRVTAQFIDGRSGHHLWSENYDRKMTADQYFAILDDIALQVVDRLQTTLSLDKAPPHTGARTSNTAALEYYLAGREQLRKPKTDQSLGQAVEAFTNAISEDAHFTEAHAGLCESQLAWYVMTRDTVYFERGEKACLRSLMLDDSLAEVYAAMGSLHRYAGRYDEAQAELETAHGLLPHSAPILEELGRVYRAQNQLELAEKTFHRAIWEEPSSWSVYKSLGNFLFRTGRYDEALPLYQRVIEIAPDNPPGYNNLGVTYYMMGFFDKALETWDHIIDKNPSRSTIGNYANSLYYLGDYEASVEMYARALEMTEDDFRVWENMAASLHHVNGAEEREREVTQRAIALMEKFLQINPKDALVLSRVALLYVRTGQDDKARRTVERLYGQGWDDPDVSFILAKVLLESGDRQSALEELKRSVEMGFPPILIVADPDFDTLRKTPELIAMADNERRRWGH